MVIFSRRRKTETVTVTRELVKVLAGHQILNDWCGYCAEDTTLVRPEHATILTGLSTREIYRAVELGEIHFQESANGGLLICLKSLTQQVSTGSIGLTLR